MDYETVEDIQPEFSNFIIGLAETFDGSRLAALRQDNKWLDEFEPRFIQNQANLDFESSQEAFRNDGNDFLKALEEFADLYYRQLVSTSLSRIYASFFMPLIATLLMIFQCNPMHEVITTNGNQFKNEFIQKHREAFSAWKKEARENPHPRSTGPLEMDCWERSLELIGSRPFWYEDEK